MNKQLNNMKWLVILLGFALSLSFIVTNNTVLYANDNISKGGTVHFSGNDYEIGQQRAKLYYDELKKWEGTSERLFTGPNGKALQLAYQYQTTLVKERSPGLFDEYRGMADGIKMRLEDIIIANLGEEVIWETAGLTATKTCAPKFFTEPACTVFAMTFSDRGPILGNTGDDGPAKDSSNPRGFFCIEKLEYEDSFRLIRCKGAGLNEAGLAIGTANAHYSDKTRVGDGESGDLSLLALRYCSSTLEAVEFIRDYEIVDDGVHLAMVDIHGDAAAIEKGPRTLFNIRWAKSSGNFDRVAWVTNTPPDPEMKKHWWRNIINYTNNSEQRYANLKRIFEDPNFVYTFDSAEKVIFNHSPVGAICQHGETDPPRYTKRTRMMLPAEGRLLLAARTHHGPKEWRPCVLGWVVEETIEVKGGKSENEIAEKKVVRHSRNVVLSQNKPNPFSNQTTISYILKEDSHVELKIIKSSGQEIVTLVNEHQQKGNHSVKWDGKDKHGDDVNGKKYYYWLKAGNNIYTKRMTLLK
jgi:hypothetical protein